MKHIVPLVWTTDVDSVDCGEYLALIKQPSPDGPDKPMMISYSEVEK